MDPILELVRSLTGPGEDIIEISVDGAADRLRARLKQVGWSVERMQRILRYESVNAGTASYVADVSSDEFVHVAFSNKKEVGDEKLRYLPVYTIDVDKKEEKP